MQVHGTTDNSSVTANCPALLLNSDGSLNTGSGTTAGQVQGNVASGAADTGNPVKIGGFASAVAPSAVTDGQRKDLWLSTKGSPVMAGVAGAGADGTTNSLLFLSDTSGGATRPSASAGYIFNGTTWDRSRGDTNGAYTVVKPVTSGGLTPTRVVTGTGGVIKASAGQLYKLHSVRNANAAVRYLHLYDKATAPTLSTDTPVLTISLAASSVQNDVDIGGDIGVAFASGIAWAYTTDNIAIPTTAGTSAELMFSGAYK